MQKEKKGNSFKGVEVIIAVIQTCFDDLKFKETTPVVTDIKVKLDV